MICPIGNHQRIFLGHFPLEDKKKKNFDWPVFHQFVTQGPKPSRSGSALGGLVICQKKLVQEAVDALLDNGIRGQPMKDSHDRPYKSFSEQL